MNRRDFFKLMTGAVVAAIVLPEAVKAENAAPVYDTFQRSFSHGGDHHLLNGELTIGGSDYQYGYAGEIMNPKAVMARPAPIDRRTRIRQNCRRRV